jgi:hypothetical protein
MKRADIAVKPTSIPPTIMSEVPDSGPLPYESVNEPGNVFATFLNPKKY